MIHKMRLADFAFNAIRNGNKDIEVRLYDEKRKLINIGDIIEFHNIDSDEILRVKVVNLHIYNSFYELFNAVDYKRLGFNNIEEYKIMDRFYTKEEQEKYDAVGIEIQLI